jgi:hypothetical protein
LDTEDDKADAMTVPDSVEEAYSNRYHQMSMMHFKVASDKNEVKWVVLVIILLLFLATCFSIKVACKVTSIRDVGNVMDKGMNMKLSAM